MKCTFILAMIVAMMSLVTLDSASAQSTPRSVCCTQMGGRWQANRLGEMRCFGVDTNAYYKCVEQRTFGKKK